MRNMPELTADFPEIEQDADEVGQAPADSYRTGDEPVAAYDNLSVVQAILAMFDDSEEARRHRDDMNEVNYDAAHCRQDTSNKIPGQSSEFLPKTAMAIEQFAAFIRKGLISFGDYFSVDLTPSPAIVGGPLKDGDVVKLMRHRLEDPLQIAPGCLDFPTLVGDGVKAGALAPRMIAKVCGRFVTTRRPVVKTVEEPQVQQDPLTGQSFLGSTSKETLEFEEGRIWRLCVELIRDEDHFPDPEGAGLFEIQRTYLDLHEVIERSEGDYPEYDPEEVRLLAEDATHYEDSEVEREKERQTDEPEGNTPHFRKRVEVLEFWGTLLDSDGSVAHRNVHAAIANRKYLIKRPAANPYWHQMSPFVVAPLLRVPFSVFHKALFDHAVRLNFAMNELFNLIVDAGIGAVWGVRQVKKSALENPEDFDNGVPQGSVGFIKEEFPDGEAFMQQLTTGGVPQDALATYQLLDREFSAASMMTDTAKGQTPRKDVSATAVASADQSTSLFFDSIISTLEVSFIQKVLHLAWLTMLQNCDDWNEEDIRGCIGDQAAQALQQMSPARRYVMYAQGVAFEVTGLSSMVARTRDFQKIMSVLAALGQSPILLQTFMNNASPQKLLNYLFKCLNINPDDFKMTPDELTTLQERLAEFPLFQSSASGAQGMQQSQIPGVTTEPGSPTQQVQGEISQMNQPPQGL